MAENSKITKNNQTLTERVWDLIAMVGDTVGVPQQVAQGGFKAGSGAGASAGTHDGGDVFDLRVVNMNDKQELAVVEQLRRWNGCAWLRSPAYGWTSTGPHIHCVMRDSYYPLSSGAKQQVRNYDDGKNGLANGGKDPFHRPPQKHYSSEDTPVTPGEIQAVADAVWAKTGISSYDGKAKSMLTFLIQANYYAISGGQIGNFPATATSGAGNSTAAKNIKDAVLAVDEAVWKVAIRTLTAGGGDGGPLVISDADLVRIAKAVADEQHRRLQD